MEKEADSVARVRKRKSRLEDSEDLQASSVQLKQRRLSDLPPVSLPRSTCETAGSYGALTKVEVEEEEVTVDQFLVTSNGVKLNRRERSELESMARPSESKPRHGCFTGDKTPSDDDLEEFFSSAEKNLQKQFIDKYNYDVVKDEPLEGRFEWVQIQQIQP